MRAFVRWGLAVGCAACTMGTPSQDDAPLADHDDTGAAAPSDTAPAPATDSAAEPTPDTGPDTAPSDPTPITTVTTAEAVAALSAAVPDLRYLSESESPVDVVVLADPAVLPSLPNLPTLVAPVWTSTSPPALADRDVEVRELSALFDALTVEQPWWEDFQREQAVAWSAVRATMTTLDGARVWRLGRSIGGGVVGGSVEVYVLGGTAEGDLVGVHFVAVET
jgi:hypothetical protein